MIRTLQLGVATPKATGALEFQSPARSASGNTIPAARIQTDQFRSKRSAKAPVRFGGHWFFGKTNAEKEASQAEDAWYSAEIDQKVPEATKQKRKADYDEAKLKAARTVKLKKRIQQAGGILGAGLGAGSFAMTGTFGGPLGTLLGGLVGAACGAYGGYTLMLPVAHYAAEAVHVIRSPEFQEGYQEARKSKKGLFSR